jgi:hypothetical protein
MMVVYQLDWDSGVVILSLDVYCRERITLCD